MAFGVCSCTMTSPRAAATALAVLVMLAVGVLMMAVPESVPLWYQLTFLVVGPVAALAGGTLCLRRRKGHA